MTTNVGGSYFPCLPFERACLQRLQQHRCLFQPLQSHIFTRNTSCRTINQGPAIVNYIPVFSFAIRVYRIGKMTSQFTNISVYRYPLTVTLAKISHTGSKMTQIDVDEMATSADPDQTAS